MSTCKYTTCEDLLYEISGCVQYHRHGIWISRVTLGTWLNARVPVRRSLQALPPYVSWTVALVRLGTAVFSAAARAIVSTAVVALWDRIGFPHTSKEVGQAR